MGITLVHMLWTLAWKILLPIQLRQSPWRHSMGREVLQASWRIDWTTTCPWSSNLKWSYIHAYMAKAWFRKAYKGSEGFQVPWSLAWTMPFSYMAKENFKSACKGSDFFHLPSTLTWNYTSSNLGLCFNSKSWIIFYDSNFMLYFRIDFLCVILMNWISRVIGLYKDILPQLTHIRNT